MKPLVPAPGSVWRALGLGLALVALGACGGQAPPAAGPGEPLIGVWYTVVAGDTVAAIAARHGVPIEDIVELNGLVDPTRIDVGQALFLYGIEELLARKARAPADPKDPKDPKDPEDPAPDTEGPPQFAWPLKVGVVSSGFGPRGGREHKGLDVAAKTGTPVYAAAPGKVIYSDNKQRGYGNLIIIQHVRGYVTVYAHNRRNLVDEGERVRQGAQIAEVGSTGRSTGPHLHFEVRAGGHAKNPLDYLPAR